MRKPFKIMLGIIVAFMCLGAVLSFTQSKPSAGNDSGANQSGDQSISNSTTNSETSFPADEKEFAHRYNSLAAQPWKITDIQTNQGLDTLQMQSGSYIDVEGNEYRLNFVGQHEVQANSVSICEWMIKAANPSISSAVAQSIATKVTSNPSSIHDEKVISDGVIVTGSPSTWFCTVSPTGL